MIIMKPKIFVAGLAGMSVFLRTDHFHENGETVKCNKLFKEPGGKGFNQAIAASRSGADVVFAYSTGFDSDGDICENVLLNEEIKSLRFKKKEECTAYADILVDKTAENRIAEYLGAGFMLSPQDAENAEEDIKHCDLVLLQLEIPFETVKKFVELAKKYDKKVILNPAPAYLLPKGFLNDIYIITPNEQEYSVISKEPITCKAVVTLGKNGCKIIDKETVNIPPVKVAAKDTTGAGDVFNGAFAYKIAVGESLKASAEYAVKASGYSVSHEYVLNGIPFPKDIAE